jgi:2-aminoadipate transaminase
VKNIIAERMDKVPESFIREILKVTDAAHVISFAGGLPSPDTFPVREIAKACETVLATDGQKALQYASTEGYFPLRQYISGRYMEKHGLKIKPEDILITTGSQQALDLAGKVLINPKDKVLIEGPGYLGAIQALSVFSPVFKTVLMKDDGVDLEGFKKICSKNAIKLFYGVPNFQNPSGITYSGSVRNNLALLLEKYGVQFIEDDPYGELRFIGEALSPVKSYYKNGILLGSFSKVVAPGLRLGWITAPQNIMKSLVIAKQAADLHTNSLSQRILYRYLMDNNEDKHIQDIIKVYKYQCDVMIKAIEEYFPDSIRHTSPEGGMFLWVTLPKKLNSRDLFNNAIKQNVAFVPGAPFYANGGGENTMRLNFSNSSPDKIKEGIARLGKVIKKMLK